MSTQTSRSPHNSGSRKRRCMDLGDGGSTIALHPNGIGTPARPGVIINPQFCPYYLKGQGQEDYIAGGKFHKTCTLKNISKLPQHIRRVHTKPVECDKCAHFRGDAGQVKEHKTKCTQQYTGAKDEGFERVNREDLRVEETLKKHPGLSSTELFKAIFKEDPEYHQYTYAKTYNACEKALPALLKVLQAFLTEISEPMWKLANRIRDFSHFQAFSKSNPDADFDSLGMEHWLERYVLSYSASTVEPPVTTADLNSDTRALAQDTHPAHEPEMPDSHTPTPQQSNTDSTAIKSVPNINDIQSCSPISDTDMTGSPHHAQQQEKQPDPHHKLRIQNPNPARAQTFHQASNHLPPPGLFNESHLNDGFIPPFTTYLRSEINQRMAASMEFDSTGLLYKEVAPTTHTPFQLRHLADNVQTSTTPPQCSTRIPLNWGHRRSSFVTYINPINPTDLTAVSLRNQDPDFGNIITLLSIEALRSGYTYALQAVATPH